MAEEKAVVLITGASSGIGRATAKRFAQGDWRVVLFARREELLKELAQGINEEGGEALHFAGDIRSLEDISRVVGVIRDQFGRLDCLVNNAGIYRHAEVVEQKPGELIELWETNLYGPFMLTRNCLPLLRKSRGTVVFVSSIAAREWYRGNAAYSATKAALAALAGVLREEEREHGVRVSVLFPGATYTPIWDHIPSQADPERMVSAEQVAEVILQVANLGENASLDEVVIRPRGGSL